MREIISQRLWIAASADVNSLRQFINDEGKAIVQLAYEESPVTAPRGIINCRFPLVDGEGNDPAVLRLAVGCVADLLRHSLPTLVTCSAGLSRSPGIVAAAISAMELRPLQDCLRTVSQCGMIDLSPSLWAEIVAVSETPH